MHVLLLLLTTLSVFITYRDVQHDSQLKKLLSCLVQMSRKIPFLTAMLPLHEMFCFGCCPHLAFL